MRIPLFPIVDRRDAARIQLSRATRPFVAAPMQGGDPAIDDVGDVRAYVYLRDNPGRAAPRNSGITAVAAGALAGG